MLHFALSQVVQMRRPLPILLEIVRYVLREKDVTGIAESITRCAKLIPAPAILVRPVRSVTWLTGPL